MDRGARTPGIGFSAFDMNLLKRAAIEVDLPGLLRIYGWQAVPGEDSQDQRVLTDAARSRRIVVSRRPNDQRWQWWDTTINVVGNIVDAIRQLLGFRFLRDIITLLRRTLDNPPEPLPVPDAEDQNPFLNRVSIPLTTEQLLSSENQHHEQPMHLSEHDQAIISILSEEPAESGDGLVDEHADAANNESTETEDVSPASTLEDDTPNPPKQGGRRR